MKIVSLVPFATEIICALGMRDSLVGRSHACDFPSYIRQLPVLTKPTIDISAKSDLINREVQSKVTSGHPVVDIDEILVSKIKPDLIVVQDHCAVCAAHISQVISKNDVNQSLPLPSNTLDDLWGNIRLIGRTVGVTPEAEKKITLYQSKMSSIIKATETLEDKPTVLALEWLDPLIVSGLWMPELIKNAGGIPLQFSSTSNDIAVLYEEILRLNPDIIVIAACGFNISRSRDEMDVITTRSGWYDLKAVQNNRVFLVDGNSYMNRLGPRLVESLEILAEICHPEFFDFGHKLEGWEYWGFDRVV